MSEWTMVLGRDDSYAVLCRSGIAAIPASISVPSPVSGIAFPTSELDRVRLHITVPEGRVMTDVEGMELALDSDALSSDSEPLSTLDETVAAFDRTDWTITNLDTRDSMTTFSERLEEAVVAAVPPEPDPVFRVEKLDMNGGFECWSAMKPVLESWANRLKRNIRIRNVHGRTRWDGTQPEDGVLDVRIWQSALQGSDAVITRRCENLFGMRLTEGQPDGCAPSGVADLVIYDSMGVIAAEVVENVLFILFDLPHGTADVATRALNLIFEEYERLVAEGRLSEEALMQRRMKHLIERILRRKSEDCKASLRQYERETKQYYLRLSEMASDMTSLRLQLSGYEKMQEGDSITEFQRELERLQNLDKVKRVTVTGDAIVVLTEKLDFVYRRIWYHGHEFKITLNPERGSVLITSADSLPAVRGSSGYFVHPHVHPNGNPCLGNIGVGVARFISSFEFTAATQVLIQYLGVANESDWYIDPIRFTKLDQPIEPVDPSEAEEEEERCGTCGEHVDNCFCWTCENCGERFRESEYSCSLCRDAGDVICEACCGGHEEEEE